MKDETTAKVGRVMYSAMGSLSPGLILTISMLWGLQDPKPFLPYMWYLAGVNCLIVATMLYRWRSLWQGTWLRYPD